MNDNEERAQVQFFLNPASSIRGTLDYSDKESKKIYYSAIKSLFPKDEAYQCEPGEMEMLLKALQNRANEYGWDDEVNGILHIPEDPNDTASPTNFILKEYGKISRERIAQFEKSYIGQQVRPAQDSYMMYQCLLNSLSKEAKIKVQVWESQYMIMNDQGTIIPSGNLLLKVIIRESHLDTNATTQSIRTKLSNLALYIQTINCNVTKFNGYVKGLVLSLSARGQRTEDLLSNLFKGYMAASDKVFVKYIGRKMENYEEGEDMVPDNLMQLADNKFRLMKEKGTWNAPSEEEEKILALQAEVEQLKKSKHRKRQDKSTSRRPGKGHQKQDSKGKRRGDASNSNAKPAWMSNKPSAKDIKRPKEWKGRKWWWCGKETGGKCDPGQWRAHHPKDCRGSMKRKAARDKLEKSDGAENQGEEKKMKLAEALSAVANGESEGTVSDSSEYESE